MPQAINPDSSGKSGRPTSHHFVITAQNPSSNRVKPSQA
jgi:hypothetical protein